MCRNATKYPEWLIIRLHLSLTTQQKEEVNKTLNQGKWDFPELGSRILWYDIHHIIQWTLIKPKHSLMDIIKAGEVNQTSITWMV